MMTRTGRFPILLAVVAALALAMAMLFSSVAAQEGSAPDKPKGLEATATHGQVVLTWDDPQDDSITGYVVLRRVRVNDTGGDFSVLLADTETAALTYTDDTVAASLTYTYRIKAINEHGVSERSRWVHIDTPAAPVPAKPRGLEATATHDSVTLTWDDPGDDSITGYVILRRVPGVDPQGHFDVLVADTGTATTYTDDTVSAETRYTYRIKAINEHGVSERSRWSHINVPAAPEAAEGDEQDGESSGGAGKRANVSEPSDGDCAASTTTTCEVDVGGSVMGNIGTSGDQDWFKVVLEADTTYQIDLKGEDTSDGTLTDPELLNIRDSSGNEIADTGNNNIPDPDEDFYNSRAVFTPTAAGAYYLVARDGDVVLTGTYTLSVREIACALNEGDIWCGVVTVAEVTNSGGSTVGHGFLGTTGDIDGNPDDKDFTVPSNSNEYTITSLMVGTGSISGSLILRLDEDLMDTTTTDDQATLELGIDGESDPFRLSTAEPVSNGGYRWDGTGLDWSSETPVTVRLGEEDPPILSVADATGDEGDDKVVFTVTLSKPYYAATSATWTASIESGDTAVAADLGTTKTGTVAIAADATTATFEVPVVDDTADENDETFTVTLSSPSHPNVVKLAAAAKGTIIDDDGTTTSTDATLSALSLGTGVTLSPAFASDTYAYAASVANSVDEVTVTPTTNHTGANFVYLNASDGTLEDSDTNTAGHQVDLHVGDTAFKVKVTAEGHHHDADLHRDRDAGGGGRRSRRSGNAVADQSRLGRRDNGDARRRGRRRERGVVAVVERG